MVSSKSFVFTEKLSQGISPPAADAAEEISGNWNGRKPTVPLPKGAHMGIASSAQVDHTLQMSVDDIGFMLDRLGRDCSPLQFLRELTQNSLDAIYRTESKTGNIVWDVDWAYFDLTGIYKLCIIDDGTGMNGSEMVRYINNLSASVHPQSHSGNFGVGAKIAAATRNHAGLVYLSWVGNVGHTIHLWRSPITNQYGLQQFTLPDGTYDHWGYLDDAVKPTDWIMEHGTKVVLLGNNDYDDTMAAPKGAPSPSRWVARYLNTRYFRFPDGVNVRARSEPSEESHWPGALPKAAFIRLGNGRSDGGQGALVDSEGRACTISEFGIRCLCRTHCSSVSR